MKSKIFIPILLITFSLVAIAFFSSSETSFTLLDASELAVHPEKYDGDNLRVRGNVKIGSVVREGREARFVLELDNREIPVHFTGKNLLPDAFKEGVKARVDGKYKNGILVADHVEAKCASKYEADYKQE
jgi:cytochrome c-type biogenesis protein CcmE